MIPCQYRSVCSSMLDMPYCLSIVHDDLYLSCIDPVYCVQVYYSCTIYLLVHHVWSHVMIYLSYTHVYSKHVIMIHLNTCQAVVPDLCWPWCYRSYPGCRGACGGSKEPQILERIVLMGSIRHPVLHWDSVTFGFFFFLNFCCSGLCWPSFMDFN